MTWAGDIRGDRPIGEDWEDTYCKMLADAGQPCRRLTGAEAVDVQTRDGYHEVKHKRPARGGLRRGCYGLEEYRIPRALTFAGRILYVIHDYLCAGADDKTDDVPNRKQDWFAADLRALARQGPDLIDNGETYFGGEEHRSVPIYYWRATRWAHLESMTGPLPEGEPFGGYDQQWLRLAAPGHTPRYEPWIGHGQCAMCDGDHAACRCNGINARCEVAACRNPHHTSTSHELARAWSAKARNHLYPPT